MMTDSSKYRCWDSILERPQGKKRKQIENDDEKQKKKQEYEKNRPDRKFPSKWQTEFYKEKNVMTCTTCIDTQTDIIESVQVTVLINEDDLDIIHNDSDIEIGHNVDTSVQCGPSHTFISYKHRNSK
jgi:hypothetical protein